MTNHRIYQLRISDDLAAKLCGTPPSVQLTVNSIRWGHEEDGSLRSEYVTDLDAFKVLGALSTVSYGSWWTIDVTGNYQFYWTTAPQDYDGFGTITVERVGSKRLVAIEKNHVEWQVSRYRSGLHLAAETL